MKNELIGKTLKELYLMERNHRFQIDFIEKFDKVGCFKKNNFDKLVNEELDLIYNYDFYYRNSKEFIELCYLYKIVLEDLSNLGQNLNWDNEMKLFAGYIYLLVNGYLSMRHLFYFSDNVDSGWEIFGCNVIFGKGNCKHVNSMLNDLLHMNKFSSYVISMLVDKNLISFDGLDFRNEAILRGLFVEENLSLDEGDDFSRDKTNHAAVLFVDDKHSYIMDALNNTIYYVGDDLNVYQGGYKFNVVYHEMYNRMYNEGKKEELKQLLRPSSIELLLNKLNDYYNVRKCCSEMNEIFEKFYSEHKDLYAEVIEKRKALIKAYNRYHVLKKIKVTN